MEEIEPRKILHYSLSDKIGEGRNGEVYRAFDSTQRCWVAVKLLRAHATHNTLFQNQFISKNRAVAEIDHPNIATIVAVEEYNDNFLLVSELVEGENLREIITREGFDIIRFLDTAIHIVNGLKEAHDEMIVHGNLRPTNIIINYDGNAKILDFGLNINPESISEEKSCEAIRYLSPEQMNGHAPNFTSDLYSAGLIFYEMITGKPAFTENDYDKLANAIRYISPDLKPLNTRKIPGDIILVINKLLEKKPEDRFENCSELLITLKAIKEFEEKSPDTSSSPKRKTTPRQYLLVSLLVILLIFLWSIIASYFE